MDPGDSAAQQFTTLDIENSLGYPPTEYLSPFIVWWKGHNSPQKNYTVSPGGDIKGIVQQIYKWSHTCRCYTALSGSNADMNPTWIVNQPGFPLG